MRRTLIVALVLAAACARTEQPAADTTAARDVTLDDFVGTWDGTVTALGSDAAVANIELLATPRQDGWSFTVVSAANPGLSTTTPARVVSIDGDSAVVEAGPFASVLRQGEQVSTRSVYRLRGGRLIGRVQAAYIPSGDTVMLHSEGTRRP